MKHLNLITAILWILNTLTTTAGWVMGIDRLVSFLANKPAIKDVILFPTLKS